MNISIENPNDYFEVRVLVIDNWSDGKLKNLIIYFIDQFLNLNTE